MVTVFVSISIHLRMFLDGDIWWAQKLLFNWDIRQENFDFQVQSAILQSEVRDLLIIPLFLPLCYQEAL